MRVCVCMHISVSSIVLALCHFLVIQYFSLQLLGHVDTKSNVSEHDNDSDTDHQDDDSDKKDDTDNEASDSDDDSDIVTEEDGATMELTGDGTDGRHPTANAAKTDNTADMNDEASSCTLSQPSEGSHQTGHGKKSHMLVHNDFIG